MTSHSHIELILALSAAFTFVAAAAAISTNGNPPASLSPPMPIPEPTHPALPIPNHIEITDGPFQPTTESLKQYECPEWFRDAKFGIWSHWGPQSVPMQDGWYARGMYVQGHPAYQLHIEKFGHPSVFGFKDIIQLWKAEKFDPEHCMDLYQRAGARYFVTMGAHHDNYDLWMSKYHKWNSVNYGPRRDIVGIWRDLAKQRGIRFGVSEHIARSYSWFNTSHGSDKTGPLAGVPYDGNDPAYQDLYFAPHDDSRATYPINAPEHVQRNWYWRMKDLIETYNPDLVYTDGAIPFGDIGRAMLANYYNHNLKHNNGKLQAVYNIKNIRDHGEYIEGAAVQDVERHRLHNINPSPWQTCNSTGPWFYNAGIDYAQQGRISIHMLIDIVSKNGNLLLNVPQRPDGSFDPEAEQMLRDIGHWMDINGEAIYATRPYRIFGEGASLPTPTDSTSANHNDPTKPTPQINKVDKSLPIFTANDLRFTQSKDGNTLYLFCLGRPTNSVRVLALGYQQAPDLNFKSVELLGESQNLSWTRTDEALNIQTPENLPDRPAFAFKIRLRH